MGLIIPSAPIDKIMKYTVYIIKDLLEGLVVYVGKTSNFNRRKQQHLGLYSNNTKDWISAIGTNNVQIMPVECFDSEEEALRREDELIIQYDTINNGYNRQRSGLIETGREKEYWQEYHQENANVRNERSKQWYQDHREEHNQQMKQWYQDNHEKRKEQNKKWQQDNREKWNKYMRDRRAAKKLGMTVKEYKERSLI